MKTSLEFAPTPGTVSQPRPSPPPFPLSANARSLAPFLLAAALVLTRLCLAQLPPGFPPQDGRPPGPPAGAPPFPGGPGGPGGPGRFGPPGGRGGPMQEAVKLVEKFDQNGDHRLDATERKAARESLAKDGGANRRGPRGGFGRRGGPGGPGEGGAASTPGARVSPADVKNQPEKPLYDPGLVRTLFLDFEATDWEQELSDFYHSDVEVPARLTVDGVVYPDVGVHFRGASSFFTVPTGAKHSLNLSLDFVRKDQALGGYRTLNLLNSHEDPSFLRTVLYHEIAREYLPAPKANFVRVVINGESWGVYVSAQQFNKDFLRDAFQTTEGARWKVPGRPGADSGLRYLGTEIAPYRQRYTLKTKENPQAWQDLIQLCQVMEQTPADTLAERLEPLLDVDGALRFLALENTLINCDGYWIRSSDYALYQDAKRRFHVIPHDANETFNLPTGPGMDRSAGTEGVKLDPLTGTKDPAKPLLHRLLAVPEYRQRYLGYVRDIATRWLDWNRLGPIAQRHHDLIAPLVQADTRKLESFAGFQASLQNSRVTAGEAEGGGRGPRPGRISLKDFAEQRREYLLALPAVQAAPLPIRR
jgi:hypothetical protein